MLVVRVLRLMRMCISGGLREKVHPVCCCTLQLKQPAKPTESTTISLGEGNLQEHLCNLKHRVTRWTNTTLPYWMQRIALLFFACVKRSASFLLSRRDVSVSRSFDAKNMFSSAFCCWQCLFAWLDIFLFLSWSHIHTHTGVLRCGWKTCVELQYKKPTHKFVKFSVIDIHTH